MNKRAVGAQKEAQAASYLEERGYRILRKNYYCRAGEIDLIARDGSYLVFVEVKYRRDGEKGTAAEAVDARKRLRICRCARCYLYETGSYGQPCRFDVVAIDGERITLYQNAFPYQEGRGR